MTDLIQMGVLSAIAVSCSLLGPFLVLNKMAMFANSLSHTVLLGIVLAFLIAGGALFDLSTLLLGALLAALLTALFTFGLIRFFRLQEDASIGLVFTSLFALGITAVSLYTKNIHLGIEAVMGNADILQIGDLKLALALIGINLVMVALFYRQFQIISFDLNLAKTLKIPSNAFHFLLLFLVSATCIGAFRAVGVLVVLVFLVGPFLTARLFCHRLKILLILTPLIAVATSILAVLLTRICFNAFGLSLSTGGMIALLSFLIYLFSKWIRSVKLQSQVT